MSWLTGPIFRAEEILKIHARNIKLSPGVDLRVIASRTPGFVGADLANIVNEAALLAARKNKESVEMADIEEAIDRVIAGLEKKSRLMSKKEKEIVAFHEAGHAIVATLLPNADPVRRISIIPRGTLGIGLYASIAHRGSILDDQNRTHGPLDCAVGRESG